MTWALDYDTAIPPLPELVEVTNPDGSTPSTAGWAALERQLPAGCWKIRLRPRRSWSTVGAPKPPSVAYEGTLRVEYVGGHIRGSGDLYLRRDSTGSSKVPRLVPPLNPSQHPTGIPVFRLDDYRIYLRLESASIDTNGKISLGIRAFRNDAISLMQTGPKARLESISNIAYSKSRWRDEGLSVFRAEPGKARSPGTNESIARVGPFPRRFLRGVGSTSSGTEIADIELQWVSICLRRIQVTLYGVDGVPFPGTGFGVRGDATQIEAEVRHAWQEAFASVGFHVDVQTKRLTTRPTRQKSQTPDQPKKWTQDDLRKELTAQIQRVKEDPNEIWGYHLLCVSQFDGDGLGQMFVCTNVNKPLLYARQGSVVAHGSSLGPSYPDHRQETLGEHPLHYLYVGIHEIGHALGLSHNRVEDGFMQDPWRSSTAPGRYPPDPAWSFGSRDQLLLRHAPDRWVRPGGYSHQSRFKKRPFERWDRRRDRKLASTGKKLSLWCPSAVLVGAPLRVHLELDAPESQDPLPALSLKAGHVSVRLLTPGGISNVIDPASVRLTSRELASEEAPPDSRADSLVLISGRYGPLLTEVGVYTLEVIIDWAFDGLDYSLSAQRQFVAVLPSPENLLELATPGAASDLRLQEPPLVAQLTAFEGFAEAVIFAEELSEEDESLLQRAIKDPLYGPHFLALETRRVLKRLATDQETEGVTPIQEILEGWKHFAGKVVVSSSEWFDIADSLRTLATDSPEKLSGSMTVWEPLFKGLAEAINGIPTKVDLMTSELDQLKAHWEDLE